MNDYTITSSDPEPPVGTVVVTIDDGVWERFDEDRRGWAQLGSDNDTESWTRVAGNYGPVRVLLAADHDRQVSEKARRDALEEFAEWVVDAGEGYGMDERNDAARWALEFIATPIPAVTPTESNPTPKENDL